MNFQLLSLFWDNLSIDCLKKRESSWIYSYQMCFVSRFHQQKQKYFLGGGSIKLRKCFTTLLAITRLLDFEVTTLPYPTRSWKTTTRWGLTRSTGWPSISHPKGGCWAGRLHTEGLQHDGGVPRLLQQQVNEADLQVWRQVQASCCLRGFWYQASRWSACHWGQGHHKNKYLLKKYICLAEIFSKELVNVKGTLSLLALWVYFWQLHLTSRWRIPLVESWCWTPCRLWLQIATLLCQASHSRSAATLL